MLIIFPPLEFLKNAEIYSYQIAQKWATCSMNIVLYNVLYEYMRDWFIYFISFMYLFFISLISQLKK